MLLFNKAAALLTLSTYLTVLTQAQPVSGCDSSSGFTVSSGSWGGAGQEIPAIRTITVAGPAGVTCWGEFPIVAPGTPFGALMCDSRDIPQMVLTILQDGSANLKVGDVEYTVSGGTDGNFESVPACVVKPKA